MSISINAEEKTYAENIFKKYHIAAIDPHQQVNCDSIYPACSTRLLQQFICSAAEQDFLLHV
jgi:hypothetical protein